LKKAILAAIITALLPQMAIGQAFDAEATKAKCTAEYQSDFQMQAFCVKQHRAGFDSIKALRPKLDQPMVERLAVCESEWPGDYQMQDFCLRQQIESRQEMETVTVEVPDDIGTQIRNACAADWQGDFQMQLFCIKQQIDGWRKMNQ
jgi:hypothetical protein